MAADDPLRGNDRYEKLKDVNSGSFGSVILARDKETSELVAIKFLRRQLDVRELEKSQKYWQREIFAHSQLWHPHIVQFKEVFLTKDYLAIAMEYVAGGTLLERMNVTKALPEAEARALFQQLITAIEYCHGVGVSNRDIKLENTLLTNSEPPQLKLIDFGYAKTDVQSLPKSLVGTRGYTAPEIVCGLNDTYDGKLADIWSCGVILYIMLFMGYPFERKNDLPGQDGLRQVIQRIINVDYKIPIRPKVSEAAKDLLRRIFIADPHKRLTVKEIKEHPWVAQDFPPNLANLNEKVMAVHASLQGQQSPEEIVKILQSAPVSCPANLGYDTDADDMASGMYDSGLTQMISQEFRSYDSKEF